jgi:hypothetical protein
MWILLNIFYIDCDSPLFCRQLSLSALAHGLPMKIFYLGRPVRYKIINAINEMDVFNLSSNPSLMAWITPKAHEKSEVASTFSGYSEAT